jgi:hypothetical protein
MSLIINVLTEHTQSMLNKRAHEHAPEGVVERFLVDYSRL